MASAVAAGDRPATVEADPRSPSPASSLGEAVDSLPPLTRTWSSGRPDTTMEVGDSVLNRAPDSLRLSKRSMRSMLSMDSGRTSMGDTDDAESGLSGVRVVRSVFIELTPRVDAAGCSVRGVSSSRGGFTRCCPSRHSTH